MKYVLFFVSITSLSLTAIPSQELFLQANKYYESKEYQKALDRYEKIPQKGAAVWYNMGNSAYKLGDYNSALLYWKRAQSNNNPGITRSCTINSALALKKLGMDAPDQSFLNKVITILQSFINSIWVIVWQVLFFCFFSIFLILSCTVIRQKKYHLLGLYSCSIIALGLPMYSVFTQSAYKKGFIMRNNAVLYAGPDCGYHSIQEIPMGSDVTIVGHCNDWTKVQWHQNNGWLQDRVIEVI